MFYAFATQNMGCGSQHWQDSELGGHTESQARPQTMAESESALSQDAGQLGQFV